MQRPSPLGLILCRQVIVDRDTGERSFIGSFDVLRCDETPFDAPPFLVYAVLTDGQGRVTLDLQVTDIDGETVLRTVRVIIELPNPLAIAHVRFRFRDLSFPDEGQYLFELFANSVSICHRRLDVRGEE